MADAVSDTAEAAAMAAAAIASGAVALPDAEAVAAGTSIAAAAVAITTATASPVVAAGPSCFASSVAGALSSEGDLKADFASSDFALSDFDAADFDWVRPVGLRTCHHRCRRAARYRRYRAHPGRSVGLGRSGVAVARGCGRRGGRRSSARRGGRACVSRCILRAVVVVPAAALLSTNEAKLSLRGDGSEAGARISPGGLERHVCAISDVTLTTGGPRDGTPASNQQGPGQPAPFKKYDCYFNDLADGAGNFGGLSAAPFSARRQDLPSFNRAKSGPADCFTPIRPILKSGLPAFPTRPVRLFRKRVQGLLCQRLFQRWSRAAQKAIATEIDDRNHAQQSGS